MRSSHHTGWSRSILGTVFEHIGPELLSVPDSNGAIGWRGPVPEDDRAIHLQARHVEDDRLVASLRFAIAWPATTRSFIESRVVQVSLDFTGEPGSALRQTIVEHASAIATRFVEMEKRLPSLFSDLFPRDRDGVIDWTSSPLPVSDAGEPQGTGESYLKLGGIPCEACCAFCTRSIRPGSGDPPALYLYDQLYRAVFELGGAHTAPARLDIGGDEPLCHPDIVSLVRLGSIRGFDPIRIHTCAVERLDRRLVETLCAEARMELNLPVYGVEAGTHDRVVGVDGHFDALLLALDLLREMGVRVVMHSVCLETNIDELAGLAAWVVDRGARFQEILYPRDEGPSRVPVPELMPRLSDLPGDARPHLSSLWIPCLGVGRERRDDDRRALARARTREILGKQSKRVRESHLMEYAPQCAGCLERSRCSGVQRGYHARHGIEEFVPIT